MALDLRLELPPVEERPVRLAVSPEMLSAGRHAFLKKRKQLDDLWVFFDDDLAAFLRAIFLAMHKEYRQSLN